MNLGEFKWNQVSSSELRLVQGSASEFKWTPMSSSEFRWLQMNSNESKRTPPHPPNPPIQLQLALWIYLYTYTFWIWYWTAAQLFFSSCSVLRCDVQHVIIECARFEWGDPSVRPQTKFSTYIYREIWRPPSWDHLQEASRHLWNLPGCFQETARRHQGGTQELSVGMSTQQHPAAPSSTQQHPAAPRSIQQTPRSTQEHPAVSRRHPGVSRSTYCVCDMFCFLCFVFDTCFHFVLLCIPYVFFCFVCCRVSWFSLFSVFIFVLFELPLGIWVWGY